MRTGTSIKINLNKASRKDIIRLGFTPEEAQLIHRARRTLPYGNPKDPAIDAEGLWRALGKPYGRFNAWADYYIKNLDAGIYATTLTVRGKPKAGYLLSRTVAAHLAMMTKTEEGRAIRDYFLLMEQLAERVIRHNAIRGDKIITTDNRLHHSLRKRHGHQGPDVEREVKSTVCRVLTGLRAGEVRERFGEGIRDVIAANDHDLDLYNEAYAVAARMAKTKTPEEIAEVLEGPYGGQIDLWKYVA